jgi:hypothetical protein
MSCMPTTRALGAAAIALATLAGTTNAQLAATGTTGPSTQQAPYMLAPAYNGVQFVSIISNGNGTTTPNELYNKIDAAGNVIAGANYRMVGIPDGMGAWSNGPGRNSFELLMNHELGSTNGIVRDHGSRGAFVSRWTINNDFSVVGGRDQNSQYNLYNINTDAYVQFNSGNPMPNYQQGTTHGVQGWNTTNPDRNGIARYCSGDLAEQSAYAYTDNAGGFWGTNSKIYMNGEETGPSGRAVAHVVDENNAYELPRLGDMSWENSIASPFAQKKTVVVGLDDSGDGNLFVYVGEKQQTGSVIDRAGLTNGTTYTVTMANTTQTTISTRQSTGGTTNDLPNLVIQRNVESNAFVLGNSVDGRVESKAFGLHNFGDPTDIAGNQAQVPGTGGTGQPAATFTGPLGLQQIGDQAGQMNFNRLEDGQFDPANPNRFFFLTTASVGTSSRIYAMDFTDITNPAAGGVITMLGDGQLQSSFSGGFTAYDTFDRSATVSSTGKAGTMEMADNMTAVTGRDGVTRLLIQEDVGGNARLGRMWLYDTALDSLLEVGISDIRLYGSTSWAETGSMVTNPLTIDEEVSGIIPAPWLGDGWFLQNMQAHYNIAGELVQGGQVMAVYIPQTIPTPAGAALLGLGGLVAIRRRR